MSEFFNSLKFNDIVDYWFLGFCLYLIAYAFTVKFIIWAHREIFQPLLERIIPAFYILRRLEIYIYRLENRMMFDFERWANLTLLFTLPIALFFLFGISIRTLGCAIICEEITRGYYDETEFVSKAEYIPYHRCLKGCKESNTNVSEIVLNWWRHEK